MTINNIYFNANINIQIEPTSSSNKKQKTSRNQSSEYSNEQIANLKRKNGSVPCSEITKLLDDADTYPNSAPAIAVGLAAMQAFHEAVLMANRIEDKGIQAEVLCKIAPALAEFEKSKGEIFAHCLPDVFSRGTTLSIVEDLIYLGELDRAKEIATNVMPNGMGKEIAFEKLAKANDQLAMDVLLSWNNT